VTSEIYGDPRKFPGYGAVCSSPIVYGLAGSVVVVAESVSTVSVPGGVNTEWLPLPPPPQLARAKVASNNNSGLRRTVISNLRARDFIYSSLQQLIIAANHEQQVASII
jgi:hypothetical protein